MKPWVEAWIWSGGSSGSAFANRIKLTEGATVSDVYLSQPRVASDALDEWRDEWNTATGSAYAWRWDRSTNRITIYEAAATTFALDFYGSAAQALGFSSTSYSGSSSYTAEGPPLVFAELRQLEWHPPRDAGELELSAFRFGRHRAAWWTGYDVCPVALTVAGADAPNLAAWLLRGRIRLHTSTDAAVASSTNLDGYLDGYVAGVSDVREVPGGSFVDVRLAVVRARSDDYSSTGRVADTLQYGHTLQYVVTVEGIPFAFSEGLGGSGLGITLPSGFPSDLPVLDVSGSSPIGSKVDRNRGIGTGLPFEFRLIDTTDVRALFTRWSKSLRLRSALTATATTIDVDSTTGWSASDQAWFGNELVTLGTPGAGPSFTGCTRGVAGYPYAHELDEVSVYGTDQPRWWRGRHVTLYALSVDPGGNLADSATLTGDGEIRWRGRISQGPKLASNGLWAFQALALDRVLARPLATLFTGEIVDDEHRVQVQVQARVELRLRAWTSAGASVFDHSLAFEPFSGYTAGDFISSSEARAAITAGFEAAVASIGAGADLESLTWAQSTQGYADLPGSTAGVWVAIPTFDAAATAAVARVSGIVFGTTIDSGAVTLPTALAAGQGFRVGWFIGVDPFATNKATTALNTHATIKLDSGDPADAPSSGLVVIGETAYTYGIAGASEGRLFLGGLRLAATGEISDAEFPGASATVVQRTTGLLRDLVPTALESSGTGQRGTYDTDTIGYGLDNGLIDEDGIRAVLGDGWLASTDMDLTYRDRSLQQLIGGLLALSGKALVGRQSRTSPYSYALTAVDTVPTGSTYVATITDSDLIVGSGDAAQTVEDTQFLNQIVVKGESGGEVAHTITLRDLGSIEANGAKSAMFSVPVPQRAALLPVAKAWAKARFAGDQVLQALELRVPLWIAADVGDMVKLELTHFRIWTFSAGHPGYTGLGRVIGRAEELAQQAATLTVLVDGLNLTRGLSPAAPVQAFDNATAPTYIDVPAEYFDHYNETLQAGGTFDLLFFEPGEAEDPTEGYSIDGVTETGGYCRLSVNSVAGSPTLAASTTYVTLPKTSAASDYQDLYAHVDDGSFYA